MFTIEQSSLIRFIVTNLQTNQAFRHALDEAHQQELVILIGPTGAGKSTLVNYCLGTRYQRTGIAGFDAHVVYQTGTHEKATVGSNNVQSQTLTPGIYVLPSKSFRLADLSGFGETRGNQTAILSNVMSQILIQRARGIRKILLTLDVDSMISARGNHLNDAFILLKRILGSVSDQALSNVIFAFSKLPSSVSARNVIERFIQPKSNIDTTRAFTKDEQTVQTVCRYLVNHPAQTLAVDVCDNGASAEALIHQSGTPQISHVQINILQQEPDTRKFLDDISTIVRRFNEADQKSRDFEGRRSSLREEIAHIRERLTHAQSSFEQRETELTQLETDAKARRSALAKEISRLRDAQSTCTSRCQTLKETLASKKEEGAHIQQLENPQQVHEESYSVGGQQEQYKSGEEKTRFLGIVVSSKDIHSWRPKGGNTTHTFIYKSSMPIHSFTINDTRRSVNSNDVRHDHTYPVGRGTSVTFRVFVKERDLPENQKRTQSLSEEMKCLEQEIASVETTIDPTTEQLVQKQREEATIAETLLGLAEKRETFRAEKEGLDKQQAEAESEIRALEATMTEDQQQHAHFLQEKETRMPEFQLLILLIRHLGLDKEPHFKAFIESFGEAPTNQSVAALLAKGIFSNPDGKTNDAAAASSSFCETPTAGYKN